MVYENQEYTEDDLDDILDARVLLANRQRHRPFWGNIKTMHSVIELIDMLCGKGCDFIDLYDLLTMESDDAQVSFHYNSKNYIIDVFTNEEETIYQFDDKWFHGAEDFLEKGRIGNKRLTSVYDLISCIEINTI